MTKKIDKTALREIPWRDFVLGFQVATEALDNPKLDELPAVDPQDPASKQARAAHMQIHKDPFLRVLLAVQDHFGEGYDYLGSFVYRFWALIHLLRRGHLSDWITHDEERDFESFHPAVLLAAAEVKLTAKAHFPPDRFLARVTSIIEEESDPDESDPAGGASQ